MPSTTWSLAHGIGIGQPVEDGQHVTGRDVAGSKAGDADTTRGTRAPSAARSASAALTSRVSGLSWAAGSSVRSMTATAVAEPKRPPGLRREWSEGGDGDRADPTPLPAQVIDHGRGRVRDRPHADHDELGILGAVRIDQAVPRPVSASHSAIASLRASQAGVEGALSDPTLHVRVLVLHHARHQREPGSK